MLEAFPALAQFRGCLEAVGERGDPRVELAPGRVAGVGGHRHQPLAQAVVHAVEDPPVQGVGYPAGRLAREQVAQFRVVVAEVAVGPGHDGVEQVGVMAARDDEPQGPSGQRRDLDGVDRSGQLGGEHPLNVLVAQRLGHRDHEVRRVAGEPGGVGLVGQPGGQPGHEAGGPDPFGQDVGVQEVLLDELAEGGGELVLALDDQRGVRYRQAERVTEQGRHREPVRHPADHGRLGAGLHVAEQGPVDSDRGDRHEQGRHRGEERGGPPPRGGQLPYPHLHRLVAGRGHRRCGHRRGGFHRQPPGHQRVSPVWQEDRPSRSRGRPSRRVSEIPTGPGSGRRPRFPRTGRGRSRS